jgi:hypothetical protein
MMAISAAGLPDHGVGDDRARPLVVEALELFGGDRGDLLLERVNFGE